VHIKRLQLNTLIDFIGRMRTAIILRNELAFIVVCYNNNKNILYENSLWQTAECTFEVFKTGFMVY